MKPPLEWVAAAFMAGVLLNADRVPWWVVVVAVVCTAWRLLAARSAIPLAGTVLRTIAAVMLVAAILFRFRTLNGLSAGTALLVLMGAIKLLETARRRDQYIMIGASLFLLLAACLDRQGLLRAPLYLLDAWLCCAALAVVAYDAQPADRFDSRAAVRLAGRTLTLAMPLALFLFLFFPRLPGAFWAIPRSDAALTGLTDSMNPGSIAELTTSYEVAFRATFESRPPPPWERYWRGPVLHDFDGATWRTVSRSPSQPPLQFLGNQYRYRVVLEPSQQHWWFALDTVTGSPSSKVMLTADSQLVASEPVVESTSYTAVSNTLSRSSGELSRAARRRETALPPERNPRSRQLAGELRARAESDRAFVAAALDFLRTGGFQYSLTPPRLGPDPVDDFLFDTRSGFCGHYASAFVELMRAGGVPARVVTGYLGGEWNPIGQYLIVRQSDAHAWAEVWLEGRGWTRVDPTGVVEPERLRRGILDLLPNAVSAQARFVWSKPWLNTLLQRWDTLNAWWNERVTHFSYDDQLRLLERLGFGSPGLDSLGWVFASGLVAWLTWIAWRMGRLPATSHPDRLARAYSRLCRKLTRAGVPREPHQGPLAYANTLSGRRPDLASAARPLLGMYAELRYGKAVETREDRITEFERGVRRLRAEP